MSVPTLRQLTLDLAAQLSVLYPAPEAEAIAALVIESLLGLSPLQRRMQAAAEVPAAVAEQVPTLLARLLRHEPVQYVLGQAHFYDLTLAVTPATLIPRPETEELVQLIIRAHHGQPGLRILDVGTGSGCIPIALSQHLSGAQFTAVDISAEALAVAHRNAGAYGAAIDFQQVDILCELPQMEPHSLHVLVSNPPYVLEKEKALMRLNVLAHEPATALFVPDHDPLLFYHRLAEVGRQFLLPGGTLYLEGNEQYMHAVAAALAAAGYQQACVHPDLFGKDRFVSAIAPAAWPGLC
ncbi:peptide chain release factor N(5)-glutamine methyltransferase [Hymenobacter aerilatus]|uniref:peptide chain release factor N(5)-glutamine methyltransferase n=1 Tax=Hymenobacter aerilatus TaxID=2932251 RepID=A0A8T9SYA3_9BACT|nr:peptide chain release factor N(5)-glutamine methyltransferase [Hymenobacter aerilatus]UOR04759.1 peptide chain release factor N(5)-glutamine methyltransferase [Hymenobacter aerilatus]